MTTKIIKMDIKDKCEHCPYCIFNLDDGDEYYTCNSLRNNYSVVFEEDEDGDIAGVVWPPIPKCCPFVVLPIKQCQFVL